MRPFVPNPSDPEDHQKWEPQFAKLINHMGDDLTVVNAARVSFAKQSQWEIFIPAQSKLVLSKGDTGLIKYLAKHGHWTPFGHCTAQFHVQAPVFVARQLVKHQIGLTWNEVSRRYIDEAPDFYDPEHWRARAEDKKQGSNADEHIDWLTRSTRTSSVVYKVNKLALETYTRLLDAGVCPEQARMVLPQSMMTQWYWTGSLYAFARVCNLRCKPDAQLETAEVCWEIDRQMGEKFPTSWTALRDSKIDK